MSEQAHHTNYTAVFIALVVAFVISLGITAVMEGTTGAVLIFIIAGIKAYLVLHYFVHLADEPRFIKILVLGLFATLALLYVALVPDIVVGFGVPKGS